MIYFEVTYQPANHTHMDTLRKLLDAECSYRMKDETMDMFLGSMTEMKLKRSEPLIPYGKTDNNIYIIKEGILRVVYFDGFKEKTLAFGQAGTVAISYNSFVKGEQSFWKYEACCDSVIMKVAKTKWMELIKQSHDFAQWVISLSMEQLWGQEMKSYMVNGDARERFESLMENRPEIVENVYSKIVASYVGVTPQYLSKLKRSFSLNKKK